VWSNWDADQATVLERHAGTQSIVVRRVKVYDDDRVSWIVDYIPVGVLPFSVIRQEFAGSVLDVLLAHTELEVEFSDCQITALGLPSDVAGKLNVKEGVPAIYLDELTRSRTGEVLNWSQAWLLPDYFNFSVRRRRPFSQ